MEGGCCPIGHECRVKPNGNGKVGPRAAAGCLNILGPGWGVSTSGCSGNLRDNNRHTCFLLLKADPGTRVILSDIRFIAPAQAMTCQEATALGYELSPGCTKRVGAHKACSESRTRAGG